MCSPPPLRSCPRPDILSITLVEANNSSVRLDFEVLREDAPRVEAPRMPLTRSLLPSFVLASSRTDAGFPPLGVPLLFDRWLMLITSMGCAEAPAFGSKGTTLDDDVMVLHAGTRAVKVSAGMVAPAGVCMRVSCNRTDTRDK